MGVFALGPELKIIALARDWGMTREQTMEYAHKHKIPVPVKKAKPYSIDENPWGRAIECGVLEDPWNEPPADIYEWTKSPDKTPDKPEYIEIGFEKGLPVSLNGKKMDRLTLIEKLNVIAGRNGIGRIDHIESRLVGIKSRESLRGPGCHRDHQGASRAGIYDHDQAAAPVQGPGGTASTPTWSITASGFQPTARTWTPT